MNRKLDATVEAFVEALLAHDQKIYGTSYLRIDADGTRTRIDPSTVMIAPQPQPVPRYKNDCDGCKCLGQHEDYDLYVHAGGLFVARFGSEHNDQTVGVDGATHPALVEAQRLATGKVR